MKETIVDSKLSEELEQGRTVEAKIHKVCNEAEGNGEYLIDVKLHFCVNGSYDEAKLKVLEYFNKLKLDTSKLMIDSNGTPVTINPKITIGEPVQIVTPTEPVVVLSGSTEKKKSGWPKGKKRGPRKPKAEVTTDDLLDVAEQKKSKKLNTDFFMNLPKDNVFSQAGR